MLAPRRELHVQHALARLQRIGHRQRLDVDDLNRVVIGEGEIDPNLTAVRSRHDENGLTVNGNSSHLMPVAAIHHQHLVSSHRRKQGVIPGHGPALQMWHLVDGEALLATAVVVQNASHPALGMPEVHECQPVLTEQPGQVVAPVRGDQAIVGLPAHVLQPGNLGGIPGAEVGDPDLAGVK